MENTLSARSESFVSLISNVNVQIRVERFRHLPLHDLETTLVLAKVNQAEHLTRNGVIWIRKDQIRVERFRHLALHDLETTLVLAKVNQAEHLTRNGVIWIRKDQVQNASLSTRSESFVSLISNANVRIGVERFRHLALHDLETTLVLA
ncbi:hypothetical protein LINPERHAP2_LOCUS17984 [Linum perenne]